MSSGVTAKQNKTLFLQPFFSRVSNCVSSPFPANFNTLIAPCRERAMAKLQSVCWPICTERIPGVSPSIFSFDQGNQRGAMYFPGCGAEGSSYNSLLVSFLV